MIANDLEQVKEFWQNRAQSAVCDEEVTHPDIWQRRLEIEVIKRFLTASDRVIDVGCGNGYTTTQIAPLVRGIVGVDFSEAMIARATGLQERPGNTHDITFAVCDVMDLNAERFGLFDVAISERCLISLSNWEDQKQAIKNISGILKEGGCFLFIEGSQDGRVRLNEFRESVGLEPMPSVWYNRDFIEDELLGFLDEYFVVEQRLNFGIYDLIARVAHPLLVAPEQPDYKAHINQVAAQMALHSQACGDISRVIFLVLRNKT